MGYFVRSPLQRNMLQLPVSCSTRVATRPVYGGLLRMISERQAAFRWRVAVRSRFALDALIRIEPFLAMSWEHKCVVMKYPVPGTAFLEKRARNDNLLQKVRKLVVPGTRRASMSGLWICVTLSACPLNSKIWRFWPLDSHLVPLTCLA